MIVATFLLPQTVDVTYSNEANFCCRGVQNIVQFERETVEDFEGKLAISGAASDFTSLCVNADQLAFLDKQGDAYGDSRF